MSSTRERKEGEAESTDSSGISHIPYMLMPEGGRSPTHTATPSSTTKSSKTPSTVPLSISPLSVTPETKKSAIIQPDENQCKFTYKNRDPTFIAEMTYIGKSINTNVFFADIINSTCDVARDTPISVEKLIIYFGYPLSPYEVARITADKLYQTIRTQRFKYKPKKDFEGGFFETDDMALAKRLMAEYEVRMIKNGVPSDALLEQAIRQIHGLVLFALSQDRMHRQKNDKTKVDMGISPRIDLVTSYDYAYDLAQLYCYRALGFTVETFKLYKLDEKIASKLKPKIVQRFNELLYPKVQTDTIGDNRYSKFKTTPSNPTLALTDDSKKSATLNK